MSTDSSSFAGPDALAGQSGPEGNTALFATSANGGPSNRAASPTKSRSLDLRAEEEAARRHNIGRALVSSQYGTSGNTSDLFGKNAIRNQLSAQARENRIEFDEDALSFLALAAESRLRSLLSQALSAQTHRTTSSHTRLPPFTSKSKTKPPRAMWEHHPVSDTNAVIEALSRQNKEAEQAFRANRMDRLARETEIQRARDVMAKREEMDVDIPGPVSAGSPDGIAGPSTPARPTSASGSTPGGIGSASGGGGGGGGGTPVFGAVSEKKSTYKKSGKKAVVTADVQHKMANATALRAIGGLGKKSYSWLSSPSVSSPLAGKKRQSNKNAEGEGKEGTDDEGNTSGTERVQPKSLVGPSEGEKKKRKRPKLSQPSRREVVVDKDANGVERKVTDDRVMTMQDVLFVLEKDELGRAMGSGNHIVRKAYALGGFNR